MRVKIAYTIELEDVENEVKEIMQRALNDIESACVNAQEATNLLDTGDGDILSITKQLDTARISLAKADIVIADCQEILMGYRSTLQKTEEEVKNEET